MPIKNLKLNAKFGYYPHEKVTKQELVFNLKIFTNENLYQDNSLNEIIDYDQIIKIIKKILNEDINFLETLSEKIITKIFDDQRVFKLTPYFFSYTVSKLILFNMTKTAAMRLAPKIRVNAIAPGPVIKNTRQSTKHFKKQYLNTLLKKQVDKKEIFNACNFFIQNQSITGQSIAIDSGQSLNWQTKDLININE